ncbi:MAG: YicC/YloC family endoribonuclease [Candidatus Neomarinimicrobiota bacterium]
MIKSMTGFGVGSISNGSDRYNIEIRSVNARFLDIKFKGFQLDLLVEDEIRNLIKSKLHRGTIYIRIDSDLKNNNKIVFDKEKYELLKGILRDINVKYGQPMNISDIISSNDLLKLNEPKTPDKNVIIRSVELALKQLDEMRKTEGEKILEDTMIRINQIITTMGILKEKVNSYKVEKQNRLRSKIEELLDDEDLDESRLIQEVAYFSEKIDVTEEIVRCSSHFTQLISYLNVNEPVGKRINFLLQEIGREINTIGSKSSQTEVTFNIVEIKDELEKIREQIQNIL